jgi:cytochrome P450
MSTAPALRVHRSLTTGLKLFDADRLRWLDEAAALGPVVALRMGPVKTWVITDTEVARAMLVTDAASWMRPPALVAPIRVGVGENLFTQSDKNWGKLQPLVAPAFRKKALDARLSEMDAIIKDEVQAIPIGETIDLEAAMGRIALSLAAWVLLGERLDPTRAAEIAHHQRAIVGWVGHRLGELTGFIPLAPGARGRAMKEHRTALHAYADEVLARAAFRGGTDDDDVLGTLVRARPSGRALTSDELRGHVLGLFFAGNETTGAALAWALVHGANAPEVWTKVRAEPERHTLPFLTESLRLNPAVWGIPRTPNRAGVAVSSAGITTRVRRGQVTTVYLRAINRDPRIWVDPLTFDPSRHDDDSKDRQRALIPFGLGPRGCVGQHLAMAELSAVIPALARHGNIAVDGTITENAGFALRVSGGLNGRFVRASNGSTNGDE